MRIRNILLLALLLTLCLGSAVFAQDSVTLDYWIAASPEELEAVQAQVQLFMDANPGITVNVAAQPEYDTQLQTAFAANDYPDVFYVSPGKLVEYADAGVLFDGTDRIVDPEGIYPSLINTYTYNGSLWCPAKDFSVLGVEYNKDMFDAAGLEYPNADWTWEDFTNAAITLTTDEHVGLIANADLDRWYAFYVQAGGHLYDADGNFTFEKADPAAAALQVYADWHAGGYAKTSAELGAGWPGEAFGQGLGAMTIEGNWMIGYMLSNFPDINWGVSEMPIGPGSAMTDMGEMAGRGTLTFSNCLAVGANTSNPDEAWALVNFLTGEEGAALVAETGFGVIPARPSAAQAFVDNWIVRAEGTGFDAPTIAAYTAGGAYAVAPIFPPGFQPFRDELNSGIQAVIDGTDTVETVIGNVTDVVTELIEEGN